MDATLESRLRAHVKEPRRKALNGKDGDLSEPKVGTPATELAGHHARSPGTSLDRAFAWQEGYGAFSVSPSHREKSGP